MTDTQNTAEYYANLLILQYLQQPRAYGQTEQTILPVLMGDSNIQFLSFFTAPTSGTFTLSYGGVSTASLNWDDSAGTIQTAFNAILISPLSCAVTGSVADGLQFEFSGYTDAVEVIEIDAGTLDQVPVISQIGSQLPLEVQAGFNLIGDHIAQGVQLDILGKYVGVSRTAAGFTSEISLNDADFLKLIQMAIVRNSSGSSLGNIQRLLNEFFAGQIYLFDYKNMHMSYLIDSNVGNAELIEAFIVEDILPRPMAVALTVIAVPVIDKFFGFRTYGGPAWSGTTPFQTYGAYDTSWLWLSYSDSYFA